MMLHSKKLKIALLTTHVPLSKVSNLITSERLESYINIITKELEDSFGIANPKINVCGLNPHAGEDGFIGLEEKEVIIPTIKILQKRGCNIGGPYSADTIFNRTDSDLVLSMFHDQALPVIKTLGFGDIVNTTLGLPIIRTSVDHGTALDIAGTNKADSKSLEAAIQTAIDIAKRKYGK
jgi:4-hydroxythreonine-4-phosphate dehydrogenase